MFEVQSGGQSREEWGSVADQDDASLGGLDFDDVQTTPDVNVGATRDPAGATLFVTGMAKGNTECTELWVELCTENGLDPKEAVSEMGTNKARKLVQIRAVAELKAQKPVPVRWYGARNHLVSWHLGGVFEEHPDLRPAGRRSVTVIKTTDSKGRPCLVVSLQTALPKRRVGRGNAAADKGQPPVTEL
jgi:hypothetical protein